MEPISVHIQKIEDVLSRMEDLIDTSRSVPFSSKISIDKTNLFDLIDEIRPIIDDMNKDLPNEITQAKRVISDSEKILNDSRNKANLALAQAEAESEKLVSEHTISRAAMEQAQNMVEEAKKSARDLRIGAMEYADEILAKTEATIRNALNDFMRNYRETEEYFTETIDTIYENRQELRPKRP